MALNRPVETSHACGFVGTPSSLPLLHRGRERFVHRLFSKVEIAQQPHQSGKYTPRIRPVQFIDFLADSHREIISYQPPFLLGVAAVKAKVSMAEDL